MGIVLPFVGGLLSGLSDVFNTVSQVWQNKRNLELQRESWMREDTAVQRRVADLKAAGLSPVLAAGSAAQSSGPIQVGAPQFESSGVSKAVELMKMKQDIATTEAQRMALQSQTNKNNAETLRAGKEIEKIGREITRQDIDNAIRQGDYNIIKELQKMGVRSDAQSAVGKVGQFLEAGKTIFGKSGSSPVISAAIGEGSKMTEKPGYVWTGKSWIKKPVETRSGSQPVRGPR